MYADFKTLGELLTVKEVAMRLKMSPSLVYRLIEHGKLCCHRVGSGRGRIRISENDLDVFLSKCRQDQQDVVKKPRRRQQLKHLKL